MALVVGGVRDSSTGRGVTSVKGDSMANRGLPVHTPDARSLDAGAVQVPGEPPLGRSDWLRAQQRRDVAPSNPGVVPGIAETFAWIAEHGSKLGTAAWPRTASLCSR